MKKKDSSPFFRLMVQLMLVCSLVSFCFTGCTAKTKSSSQGESNQPKTHQITDMSGRKVTIPTNIKKVCSLSNNTTVDLYILAPDKLVGWSFTPKPEAKSFIPEEYFNLPNLGTNSAKSNSYESILSLHPDLIVCSDEDEVYSADDLQKQLNIPVVKVTTDLDSTDKVYEFLGDCLGEQTRAKELAEYSRKTLDKIKEQVSKIPENKKMKVYYAEGATWLQTDISGNVHTEALDFAGGKNVASIAEAKTGSMANVSLEQVLNWNPDFIIVGATAAKGNFFSKVYGDSGWQKINAVKNKKIYKIPSLPFNWFDRPPSAVRVLGVEWLASLLYPEYVNIDIKQEIKNYYQTFYNYKLTDQDMQTILKDATAN